MAVEQLEKRPSASKVNRAGRRLRQVMRGEAERPISEVTADLRVIEAFRAAHAEPLTRVAAGLRYYVARHSSIELDGKPIVGQRLKRMRTIIDKLSREPTMALSRMEDIGGCRALFASIDEIDALVKDLRGQKRWDLTRERDYIRDPKSRSGYRGLHVIVEKDDCRIEVQLRTLSQHAWAELVEASDRDAGFGLKEGRASIDVTEYYRLGAELLAASDEGVRVDPATIRRFQELHRTIQ